MIERLILNFPIHYKNQRDIIHSFLENILPSHRHILVQHLRSTGTDQQTHFIETRNGNEGPRRCLLDPINRGSYRHVVTRVLPLPPVLWTKIDTGTIQLSKLAKSPQKNRTRIFHFELRQRDLPNDLFS